MFKIGEFSKLTQVSIRMLRYYDEAGLLKPAKIDKFTGYRFYSVDQIPLLHKIVFLRDSGFQVSEIVAILSNGSKDFIVRQLLNKQNEIETIIKEEQERIAKIEAAVREIQIEQNSMHYDVTLKKVPSYPVISLRKRIPNYFSEGLLWKELTELIERADINVPPNTLNFAIYHDVEYIETNVDVEVCVTLPEPDRYKNSGLFRETEEVETMACMMVYGPFENIGPAFETFACWLSEHNQYKMIGLNRQICHRGPWNEENPDQYLTEIQIPVEKAY
ncbi:MAG: MerR family transcriptional regulator [Bacillota bacterium]